MKRAHSFAAALLFACTASTSAFAGSDDGNAPSAAGATDAAAAAAQADVVAADFGTGTNILQIPPAAFTLRNGTAPTYAGLGYWSSNGFAQMWAPVWLPAGAQISFFDAYYCDNSAGHSGTFFLTRYEGWDDGNRVTNDMTSLSSVDGTGSGCTYAVKSFSHSVNNNVRYNGGGQYVVIVSLNGTGFEFKATDIWWSRPISPAPATASFTDVPTGHPFFQMIEALKASGITSGCTASTYCPNDPVTRGQMAVFLARALGLYWPL
jgi:hypothetical protein